MNDFGSDTDSEDEGGRRRRLVTRVIEIHMMNTKQLYDFRSNEHLEQLAAKCRDVDVVKIRITDSDEVQDSLCKTAFAEIQKVFRPRREIVITNVAINSKTAQSVIQGAKLIYSEVMKFFEQISWEEG